MHRTNMRQAFVPAILVLLSLVSGSQADWPTTVKSGSKGYEVALVQSAINEVQGTNLKVDGEFGSGTEAAVRALQKASGIEADGIVGPQTWKKLCQAAPRYIIRFERGASPANDPNTEENDSLYECAVKTLRIDASGIGLISTHRGSVLPSNMNVKGRVNNGWYRLHLGIHRRSGTPTSADLVVKTTGALRPCLVVNEDNKVPVTSNDPNKTTSTAIHIHNGFNTDRHSDGCQTIAPSHWSAFISHFLNKYTKLDDWHRGSSYRGREIGVLVIE